MIPVHVPIWHKDPSEPLYFVGDTSEMYIETRTVFTPIPSPTRNRPNNNSSKPWACALFQIGGPTIIWSHQDYQSKIIQVKEA